VEGAGADLHVVGLENHAAFGGPIGLKLQYQRLEAGFWIGGASHVDGPDGGWLTLVRRTIPATPEGVKEAEPGPLAAAGPASGRMQAQYGQSARPQDPAPRAAT